jgi:hypothetical protein
MPSIWLLPPFGASLRTRAGARSTRPATPRPGSADSGPFGGLEAETAERSFVVAALERARAFHAGLARRPDRKAPVPVHALGGDCLLTLARAVAGEGPAGSPPRLVAQTRREQDLLFEAGDGRVTRASFLAMQLADEGGDPEAHGIPELSGAFFGSADHTASTPTRRSRPAAAPAAAAAPPPRAIRLRRSVGDDAGVGRSCEVIETLRRRDQQYRRSPSRRPTASCWWCDAASRRESGASVLLARPRGQLVSCRSRSGRGGQGRRQRGRAAGAARAAAATAPPPAPPKGRR